MKVLSCEFNIDTACVELVLSDGTLIAIDCDVYYYQYDLLTGEAEQFDGYVEDWNTSVCSYAFVGNNIFFTIETIGEQVHYQIDLAEKEVIRLKSEPFDLSTSFVYT